MSAADGFVRLDRPVMTVRIAPAVLLLLALLCAIALLFQVAGPGPGVALFDRDYPSPVHVARAEACGHDSQPEVYEVGDIYERTVSDGEHYALVVYHAVCPSSRAGGNGSEVVGYELTVRRGSSWRLGPDIRPRSVENLRPRRTGDLVAYEVGGGENIATGRFTSVEGLVMHPDRVAVVEVSFANGRVVRDEIETHGGFIALAPGTDRACELRAINDAGRVLQRFDLSSVEADGDPTDHDADCRPD